MLSSRKACIKIFGAISSPLRFEILRCLQLQGPSAYSEIMSSLKLDPSRDAGKFAYHLREVLQTGLISLDREMKKYQLTSLGKMLLAFSQEVEEQVLRGRGKLLVRTSRLTIEEFDRNRIVQALIREAGMPTELAEKISQIAEERLIKLSTKYLTAPLIREFVNAILIERGLEQYRHELTRLGLPVYDVSQTILKAKETGLDVEFIHRVAGDRVIEEYTLLKVLPRKIADAHLSGQIHICNLGNWILKPTEVCHDLRSFLHGEPKRTGLKSFWSPLGKPKSLESALLMVSSLLKTSNLEVLREQSLNYFNVFLAPFAGNKSPSSVERSIKHFLMTIAQPKTSCSSSTLSLSLELSLSDQLKRCNWVDFDGGNKGSYGDLADEAQLIAESVLKVLLSMESESLVQMPRLIIPVRKESVKNESSLRLLREAHELVSRYGSVYFSNLTAESKGSPHYFANGNRMGVDWSGDWELDTLRGGILDTVVLNLPRIAYEARGSDRRFFDTLKKFVPLAMDCLDIKYQAIKERMDHGLLPLLSSMVSSEHYMRLQNSQRLVSFVGLYEATSALIGKGPSIEKDLTPLTLKILKGIESLVGESQSGTKTRTVLSSTGDAVASQRLAEIDVERFGWANVKAQGTKQYPYYTSGSFLPPEENVPLLDRISVEEAFHPILAGGHILTIQISEEDGSPEDLFKLTSEIVSNHTLGFFTYSKNYTLCQNCGQDFDGIQQKCSKCGSASLNRYVWCPDRLVPLSSCSPAQQISVSNRQAYRLSQEFS